MTYEKALKRIKELIKYGQDTFDEDNLEAMEAIAINIYCEQALEKQIPKHPIGEDYFYGKEWHCPSCDAYLPLSYHIPGYCPDCGQALDWREI